MTRLRLSHALAGALTLMAAACAPGAEGPGAAPGAKGVEIGTNSAMMRLLKHDPRSNPARAARVEALAQAGAPAILAHLEKRAARDALYQVQDHGGITSYLSADGSLITLERGFLAATRGLGGDLMSSEQSRVIAMVLARREGAVERTFRHLDGDDRLVAERFVCRVENRGEREISVLDGGTARTTLMAEICVSERGELRNLYWVGAGGASNGQLVQSRQWAGDWLGTIAILH